MVDWCLFDFLKELEYSFFLSLDYVKRIKNLSWGGGRKCGAFLSSLDRDPHPTCTRFRGKICTKDITCDFCVGWCSAQWELFAKKRTYAERKRSRPSGSVPPAPKATPRAQTSSEVMQPGTSPSSASLPSGGQVKRGESQGAPGVASREAFSPSARRVEVSLVARLLRASAPLSLQLLRELQRGRLLVRSGLPLPAPLPRLPLPAHRSTLCDAMSREESSEVRSDFRDPPVFPDLRIAEQRRIAEPALGRTALVTGTAILALALLNARG